MKRIQVLSDLHIDVNERCYGNSLEWPHENPMADVVVIAGDLAEIGWSCRFLEEWLAECFPTKPVIYVPGNHDYYGSSRQMTESMLLSIDGRIKNFHVLIEESILVEDMWFLGTPLWTDFRGPLTPMERAQFINGIGDFQRIKKDPGLFDRGSKAKLVRPEDYTIWFRDSVEWIESEKMRVGTLRPTVVVTHWAPTRRSTHHRFAGSWMNPFFTPDAPPSIYQDVNTWIHGHVHDSFRYHHGGARIVCNPFGYRHHGEGQSFDPHLLIEVE